MTSGHLLLLAVILGSCTYDAHFDDCAVHCTTDVGCPIGLVCEADGFCRTPGATETCAAVLETFPSCAGLAATCGPNADEDCCSTAAPIPGGTFFRSYDVATDGLYTNTGYPATVSAFVLDRYEVTVGRFRKFVIAGYGTRANPPGASSGAHVRIPGSGWDQSWNDALPVDTAALVTEIKCDSTHQTWTDAPDSNEDLPINCVTWHEAMAFCIWDGGYLPTEAEWNLAAAGGGEQRAYPWSSPAGSTTIDCSFTNYYINDPSGTFCVNGTSGAVNRVGSESPKGDGKWGQSDLGGNVWEWNIDWWTNANYPMPCDDCANLAPAAYHVIRGGPFHGDASRLRTGGSHGGAPPGAAGIGMRCARTKEH